ncbi:MAG: purine-nucleoside phosphorylase [Anaerolineales bacterium]|nr:purine-nucleoside phosphorylase [Anaerolineales bacterium]
MPELLDIGQIDRITEVLRSELGIIPDVGIILGSGLGDFANQVTNPVIIEAAQLPGWPRSTVCGHKGRIIAGVISGKLVLILQGRFHYYEGYSISQVGLPIRVMQRLGIKNLILTNAAGAVNPDFEPGDVMLITDHLNLVGMAGISPLRGPNLDEFGPRFPDMSQVYDRDFCQWVRGIADEKRMNIREGVYICLGGPNFESPADLRFLRIIGSDAVGMSTVPEAVVAFHGGMRILGLSGISNKANLDGSTITTHEEVLEAGKILVPKMTTLITEFLKKL